MGSKDVTTLTYEDLPFLSKFFFTDGSENPETLFPDETRQSPQIEIPSDFFRYRNFTPVISLNKEADFTLMFPTLKLLDTSTALEAACGDSKFLVRI